MSELNSVTQFLVDSGTKFFGMITGGSWGIIGYGMVGIFVISRAVRFIKRLFM